MSNGNKKNYGTTLYFSQFGGERSIPEQFVAAMERAETRTTGYPADAKIPQEVRDDVNVVEAKFDPSERRTNEKVLVVIRKLEGNITLQDFRTTDQGLTLQVDSTLFYTTDNTFVREYPSSTQDVAIRDLGNRWSIQEVAVMGTWVNGVFTPGIYQGIELSIHRDDPVPNALSAGLPLTETQSIIEGTVEAPTLGDDDLSASERQIAQSKKLLTRLGRDPITLPATVKYVKELTDLLPARFRGLIPTERTGTYEAGTATEVTLGTGELLRSEEQVNALTKLVEVLSRADVEFPVEFIDTATITEYGGGKVTITSSVDVEGTYTVDEGEEFVSSKITKLGEGHELKETVERVAGAWPVRNEAHFVARLQLVVPSTKQVVAKGSTTPGISAGVLTEVVAIDGWREDRIITTQPLSTVDSYVRILYGNNTNVDVPPHLESLIGYVEKGGGAGYYSETGSYVLSVGSGYGSIQLRGTAQASASALPELAWLVKLPKTSNIPCIHVLLYVANSLSRANIITAINVALGSPGLTDWPDFRPQPTTVKGVGGKVNIQMQLAVSAHDSVGLDYLGAIKLNSNSRSSGTGTQVDTSIQIKIFNIPPTIHGSLSINGTTSDTESNSASGTINGGVNGAIASNNVGCSSTGSLAIISSTSATSGTSSYSGLALAVHRLISEPDPEFNRTRVFAEIINFADVIA